MANGQTNRLRVNLLDVYFRGATQPSGFFLALCTSGSPPTDDTNVFSDLVEIATGNGYDTVGGYALTPGATDFDVLVEDDGSDQSYVQIKDVEWLASGGPIPASGDPVRYVVLLGPNATPADREVLDWWDFGGDIVAPDGSGILVRNLQTTIKKPA
jgi:hypothetical protein